VKIIIKGHKRLKIDPGLRSYIEEKIRKYEPMVKEPATSEVVLSDTRGPKGGVDKVVRITMTLPGCKNPIFVCERTSDFFGSVDLAQERLEQHILKYKERVKMGSRYPAKYYLAKMYEAGTYGPRWLIRKIKRKKSE